MEGAALLQLRKLDTLRTLASSIKELKIFVTFFVKFVDFKQFLNLVLSTLSVFLSYVVDQWIPLRSVFFTLFRPLQGKTITLKYQEKK